MSLPWWAIVLIVVVALALISPFLTLIRNAATGVKTLFKGMWWLISLPFKGIKALIDKRKEKKKSEENYDKAKAKTKDKK